MFVDPVLPPVMLAAQLTAASKKSQPSVLIRLSDTRYIHSPTRRAGAVPVDIVSLVS